MTSRVAASAFAAIPFAAHYLNAKTQGQANGRAECQDPADETRRAICVLDPQPNHTAKGVVRFEQPHFYSKCKIDAEFSCLSEGKHGFHVHQFGNLLEGCTTTGPHYNPFKKTHGGPDSQVRHVGDLGNVVAGPSGLAEYHSEDSLVTLFGAYSVLGRSCVLHAGEDDLGEGGHELSKTTGNSGGRVACGVIGTCMP